MNHQANIYFKILKIIRWHRFIKKKSTLAFFLIALKMFLSYVLAVFCLIAPSYGKDINSKLVNKYNNSRMV